MTVTIKSIRVTCAAPEGISLSAVQVDTNVPDLYDLGYGTLSYRYLVAKLVMGEYLTPLLKRKDTENIEELWQLRTSGFRSGLALSRPTL